MPSADLVLAGLAEIANRWTALAIAWHVCLVVLLLAIGRSRLSAAGIATLTALPFVSVSALAWTTGNPFNGTMFAALAIVLGVSGRHVPRTPAKWSAVTWTVPGLLLIAFGWSYPHFLGDPRNGWLIYAYAAPLGLLPCPTLAAAIGVALSIEELRTTRWSAALVAAGLLYGAIGVFRLGVALDYGLLAGVVVLAASFAHQRGLETRIVRSPGDVRHLR